MARDIDINNPIVNGDWNIIESDHQHIQHILMAKPGDYKNAPLLGVNIREMINGTLNPKTVAELEKKIRLNLEADGVKNIIISIDSETSTIYTDGTY